MLAKMLHFEVIVLRMESIGRSRTGPINPVAEPLDRSGRPARGPAGTALRAGRSTGWAVCPRRAALRWTRAVRYGGWFVECSDPFAACRRCELPSHPPAFVPGASVPAHDRMRDGGLRRQPARRGHGMKVVIFCGGRLRMGEDAAHPEADGADRNRPSWYIMRYYADWGTRNSSSASPRATGQGVSDAQRGERLCSRGVRRGRAGRVVDDSEGTGGSRSSRAQPIGGRLKAVERFIGTTRSSSPLRRRAVDGVLPADRRIPGATERRCSWRSRVQRAPDRDRARWHGDADRDLTVSDGSTAASSFKRGSSTGSSRATTRRRDVRAPDPQGRGDRASA